MGNLFTFIASGWPPETDFHAALARALSEKGHCCHAVVLGPRYSDAYRASNAFTDVHDLTTWTQDHWEPDMAIALQRLEEAEARYGNPSYWQYLAADRFLCRKSYDDNIRTALAQTTFWEHYLAEHSPSLLIGEISHFHNYLAWAIGRYHTIPFAHLIPARVPQCCACGDGPFEHRDLVTASYRRYKEQGLPEALRQKAATYIADFQNRTTRAAHLQEVKQWHKSPVGTGTIGSFLADIPRYYSPERDVNYTLISPFTKLHTWATQLARKISMTAARVFTPVGALPDSAPFVLFGLHLQPESSTLIRGQFFQDMGAVARNIALSLPAGYRLFVKEHDVMFGRRPRAFYRDLENVANIELVSPYESGPALARKAAAIAVVTGTFGWDAILLGKPAIVLGEPFFAGYDGIYHVTDPTRLPAILQQALQHHRHDPEDQLCFVGAVLDNVLPASMDVLWGLRDSGYDRDADIIAAELISRAATYSTPGKP